MHGYDEQAWDDLMRRRDRHLAQHARKLIPQRVRTRVVEGGRAAADRLREVPGAEQAQEMVDAAVMGAADGISRVASTSLRTNKVLGAYRDSGHEVDAITDIRRLELRTIDSVMPNLSGPYIAAAAVSGVSAGFVIAGGEIAAIVGGAAGGAAGVPAGGVGVAPGAGAGAAPGAAVVISAMAADAAATLFASMRVIFHVAAYYGYDVNRPEERLRALGVLNFATASGQGAKNRAYIELNKLVGLIVRNAGWKQLDNNVITKIVSRVFSLLGWRLTKRKLASAVPIAGIVIGATFNMRTLSRVADSADFLYREQFLREKGFTDPTPALDADGDGDSDVFDVPLVDIIEEMLETEDPASIDEAFPLQFDPAQIEPLASRFSYADDTAAASAGAAARGRGFYTLEELVTICRWKTARSAPLVDSNDVADVKSATRRSLESNDEGERIKALLTLRGVAVPTASALLHFAFPDRYPILDVRALESLGRPERGTYSVTFWLRYLEACRRLAAAHGVPIRTLDKALWQHSKEDGSPDRA